jgi:hypothetical protein
MTDRAQMRKTMLDAIDTEKLLSEINEMIVKPSHFTLIDSTHLLKKCKATIELLSRLAEENASAIKG